MTPTTARSARRLAAACSISAAAMLSAVGCGGGGNGRGAQPLTADDFARRNGVTTGDVRGNGQTGETLVGPSDAANGDPVRPQPPTPPPASGDNGPSGISPAVAQAVPGPVDLDPTTRPSSRPAGGGVAEALKGGDGVWVPIGSVVMEVNSQPIYSHRVLQMLEKPLSAEAKRNNPAQFKQVAAQLIGQQVQALKQEELEVAAAEKNLGTQDKSIADNLTMQWRAKQITAAGGSLEMARKRYRDEGQDFEDEVARARRRYLVQLFYSKKVFNLVAAPAYAIREYYQQNLDKEFTTHARLRFRVIRIDPAGSKPKTFVNKDEAVAFAEQVKKRAATEDFGKLADEVLADGSGGRAGTPKNDYWIQPGSYRYEAVEKAVGALRPGQVTDVIQEGGLLFVAKLDDVQEAKVKPFDDPEVQDTIAQKLKGQQVQAMRERHIRELERSAVTQYKPGKMEEMLEVAMRRYPEWAGPKAAIGP
ncbi:MAG TPA: peptidyl-prolyl cis-trans isomerase [Humisphaera sp.]